ncbi:amidohydrolase family protein [Amycolatopsis sp. NPDC050768]|uniref:dihydroorotase n=1 Tax=Amycolatopsis sp. NPDC050768 TaxID=3154839 RepID=UPI0033BFED05
MKPYDLRLHGGRVVLPGTGLSEVDVCVRDGKIAAICSPSDELPATETVDVTGRWVLPGAIDAHVHLGQDLSVPKTVEDAALETASAAAGGVTTMLAYLMSPRPYDELFPAARDLMAEHAHTDFGFHFCVVTPEHVESIGHYTRDLGVSSFKVFTNFRGNEGAYLNLPGNDDSFLFDALQAAADSGAMIAQHAENIELVWRLRERLSKDPDAGLDAWHAVRPPYVEAEAEGRVAYLASVVGASSYAVHVTSREALSALERQRAEYPDVFVETCPHYLTLGIDSGLGSRGKVNPPLRTRDDREALWEAVADGRVDVIGSDHVPRHFSAKDKDLWSASAGFPGTGTLLPLLLSEGHFNRGIPVERLVDLTATRPARLFGLWPRKGAIRIGADADFAVIDPNRPSTVAAATQHSGAEYSVWEGWESKVSVQHTILGGEFTVRDGEVQGPRGQFLSRRNSGRAALAASAKQEVSA